MLFRQTLGYLPAQLLGPLAQLVSIIAWTHLANEHVIGVVTFVTVTQDLLAQVGLIWWTGYLFRFFRAQGQDQSKLLASSFLVVGLGVVIQGVLAIANVLVFVDPTADAVLCAAIFAFVALRGINSYNLTLASIREQPLDYSVYALCGPLGGFLLGVTGLWLFGPSPLWPVLGYAIGEGAAVAYGLFRSRHETLSFTGAGAPILAGFVFGFPIALSSAFEWLVLNLPRYAVDSVMGIDAVGQYAVGFGLGQRATSLAAMAVTVAAYPLAIRRSEESGHGAGMAQVAENVALLVGVMAPSLVGLWLVSGPLVRMAIGETYWQSTLALMPWSLLAGGLTALTLHFLHHVILLEKRTWTLVGAELATILITIACVLPALRAFGMVGAVIAIVAGRGLVGAPLLGWFMLRRGLVLPWRSLAYVAIATVAMAAVVLAIPEEDTWQRLGLHIAAGATTYALFIAIFYRNWISERLRNTLARAGRENAA